jgi:hypothetical protein
MCDEAITGPRYSTPKGMVCEDCDDSYWSEIEREMRYTEE